MRVLVTGATGFIGGHVADACLDAGHETRALVRPQTPSGDLSARGVEVVAGDITDPGSVARAIDGVDAVMHLAALYAFWAPDPAAFERANVEGTLNVAKACEARGVRLVYCSTVAAVGASARPEPLDENAGWDLERTGDRYIITKRRAEEEVMRLISRGSLECVIVNPSGPLGARDVKPTPTGDLLVKFCNGLVRFWLDGGINVVDVRDVARGHLLALDKGRSGERYIIGGENLTIRQIVERFAAVTGLPGPLLKVPYPAALAGAFAIETAARLLRRPPLATVANARSSRLFFFCSHEKARRELGYESAAVDDAIAAAVRWFAERGYLRPARARLVLRNLS